MPTANIPHFINGQTAAGSAQRAQDVFNPATGAVSARVALANAADVDAAVAAAQAAFPGLGRHAADPPRARHVQVSRAGQPAQGRARAPDHAGARQGVHRRARRGGARHRHHRIRLRHPAAAQGRLHRPGLHRHGQLDHPPAAGRGGRHHAVQLPRHGAHVDVPGGDRRGQQLRAQTQPDRPLAGAAHGRAAQAGRPARRRVQRGAGRQGGGGRAAGAPGREGHQLRRLHADRELHLRDRRPPRQTRAGPGRRQEPHGGDARRRPRPGGGRADRRGLRLGRRALHGHQRGGAGGRRGRQDHAAAEEARRGAEDQERPGTRRRDGPHRHPRRATTASPATSRPA